MCNNTPICTEPRSDAEYYPQHELLIVRHQHSTSNVLDIFS
jgi:hypothetical protein